MGHKTAEDALQQVERELAAARVLGDAQGNKVRPALKHLHRKLRDRMRSSDTLRLSSHKRSPRFTFHVSAQVCCPANITA